MDGHPSSLKELREALKASRPAVPVSKMGVDDIKKELDYHATAKKTLAMKEARLAALAKGRETKAAKKTEKSETKSDMFPAVGKKETAKPSAKAERAALMKRLAELEDNE